MLADPTQIASAGFLRGFAGWPKREICRRFPLSLCGKACISASLRQQFGGGLSAEPRQRRAARLVVRALFPHAFRGRRLVNRDRFRAGGGPFANGEFVRGA